MGMENTTRDLIQSDTDSVQVQAPQPAAMDRSGNSPLIVPLSRGIPIPTTEGSPVLPKSHSTSRMAFMRRPKRSESASTKMRKMALQDHEDDGGNEHTEDPGHSFLYDQAFGKMQPLEAANGALPRSGSEAGRSAPPAPPVPEGNLKKKVARIERSIAEQTAWVRQKFDLDESDVLRESCSAALVQKIMLQGRLHITDTCMCFYAKIFGIVTKEKWSFSTIQSVRKRRGGFVANSIKITFLNPDTPPVIIASLNRRESTLAIISSRLTLMNPGGERAYLGGSMGEDSEGQSADDYHSRPGVDPHRSDRSNSSNQMSASDQLSRPSFEGTPGRRFGPSGHESTTSEDAPDGRGRTEKKDPGSNSAPNPALDALVWASSGDSMDRVHGKEFMKKAEQARGTFDVPPIFVFNELFVSNWAETYNTEMGNFDVESTAWQRGEDGVMGRELAFRHPLAYRIGPKETRVKEKHRYSFTSDGGVLIEVAVRNLDAPFGDYFVVEMYFELKPANNGHWCELVSSVAVHFMKSTMLRSKIESGTLAETKIAFTKMIELGRSHVNSNVSKELVSAYLAKNGGSRKKANGTKARTPVRKQAKEAKSPKTPVQSNAHEVQSTGLGLASTSQMNPPQQTRPTIIQVQDTTASQLLRVVAIAGLIMVCILLVLVLLSFRRMKQEFQVLQTIVREMQAGSAMRSGGSACGA